MPGKGGGRGVDEASGQLFSALHWRLPLLQVGVDTRCTSHGPSPCQTPRAAWTPALVQVKGPHNWLGAELAMRPAG